MAVDAIQSLLPPQYRRWLGKEVNTIHTIKLRSNDVSTYSDVSKSSAQDSQMAAIPGRWRSPTVHSEKFELGLPIRTSQPHYPVNCMASLPACQIGIQWKTTNRVKETTSNSQQFAPLVGQWLIRRNGIQQELPRKRMRRPAYTSFAMTSASTNGSNHDSSPTS